MSAKNYDHKNIESKWQKAWAEQELYKTIDQVEGKENFYTLFEFPYPSGNLHVGHWYAFGPTDVIARYHRMSGKNVLFPVGFDSFGLPAENAAIKRGLDPQAWTYDNIATMTGQIKSMGTSVDWSRQIKTSDPEYYKWTQYIFTKFLERDLAYESLQEVNYCPGCKTVLANEQVAAGECERCGSQVEKKTQKQWTLRITDYAEELLNDLEDLDWPEEIKAAQRAWIGKSEGANFTFQVKSTNNQQPTTNNKIVVFTTRPDTLYGVTYLVIAPEHGLVASLLEKQDSGLRNQEQVEEYVKTVKTMSDIVRQSGKEKTGVLLEGIKAIHPATGDELPIFVADYVLGSYGTGAVMAVPAHDERDFEFARTIAEPILAKRPLYFILDFDGVVGDTFSACNESKVAAGLALDLEESIRTTMEYHCNPVTHSKAATEDVINGHDNWTRRFGAEMEKRDFPMFQDFIDSVKKIDPDKVAIVSAGSEAYVKPKSLDTGLPFTHLLAGEDHHSKEEKIEQICRDWGVDLSDVYYFTDSLADVYELENLLDRTKIIGCSWGYLGKEKLLEALPENQVLESQHDIIEMFKPNLVKQVIAPYTVMEGLSSPQSDNDIVEFEASTVIIKHWEEDKYLIVKFSNGERGLVGGSCEEGESRVETARREAIEESGYNDIKSVKVVLEHALSRGYKERKNREELCTEGLYLVELASDSRVDIVDHEIKDYEWMSGEDILKNNPLVTHHQRYFEFYYLNQVLTGHGKVVNSGEFDGIDSVEAGQKITQKFGKPSTTYRLRDWSIGRQRYWGTPIPVVYDPDGKAHPIPPEHLPWLLPDDVDHTPDGTAPLGRSVELKKRTEQIFGKGWTPATDTMDTFVDSSWYYLRYTDPQNDQQLATSNSQQAWMPVDFYSGGAEHTTMHLLYSRFFYKAMRDCGLVSGDEPFKQRMNRSLILGPDGNKMSKSKGNVIDPDTQVGLVGADAVRMYLCFMGPYNEVSHYPWDPNGLVGVRKFLERLNGLDEYLVDDLASADSNSKLTEVEIALHKAIQKVTESIEQKKLNTGVSALMIFVNLVEKQKKITKQQLLTLTRLVSVYAPHLAEEWWHQYGGNGSVHATAWPVYDENILQTESVIIPVQVNGKRIGEIRAPRDAAKELVEKLATADTKIKFKIKGDPKKIIYVKNRILNLVIDKNE